MPLADMGRSMDGGGVVVRFPGLFRAPGADVAPRRSIVPDATPEVKRSAWTVVASVAAGLVIAGAVTVFSGIASVPNLVVQVATLTVMQKEEAGARAALEREVTRLTTEDASIARQLLAAQQRIEVVASMLERVQSEQRAADLAAQKGLVEVEGKSANRNTEAKGLIAELRSEIASLRADLTRVQDGRQGRAAPDPNRSELQSPGPSLTIQPSQSRDAPEFGHMETAQFNR
jgi:hypothetical protein